MSSCSDIDIVLLGRWKDGNQMYVLEEALRKSGIARDIKLIEKASVPLVKVTDRETDIKVDISFNTVNGLRAAKLVRLYRSVHPTLTPLIFVLKQHLYLRKLNEVRDGDDDFSRTTCSSGNPVRSQWQDTREHNLKAD